MPWLFTIPEFVKKRACRYLLQHYLGQYLVEKIQLEDLTVDLYNGTGTITNVPLKVEAINDTLEGTGAPVEVVSGYLGRVTISVPWSSLMSDSCKVEVTGLMLSVMPRIGLSTTEDLATMTDSLFLGSNMSSSMRMAEEVLKSGPVEGEEEGRGGVGESEGRPTFEGMEALARAIETVLSRVQINLRETVIQLVTRSSDYTHQYFIRLRIDCIKFYDELRGGGRGGGGGGESSVDKPGSASEEDETSRPAAVETKILEISEITVELGGVGEDIHTSTVSPEDMPGIPVASISSGVSVTVKVRSADGSSMPRVQVDVVIGAVHCLLAPSQLHILHEITSAALRSRGSSTESFELAGAGVNRPIPGKELHDMHSQLRNHIREEKRKKEHRKDLLRADPYQGQMGQWSGSVGMTESMMTTSPDMFYSLNLHDSFSEATSRSEISGERSMESSVCTTDVGSLTTMGDSFSSIHTRSRRRLSQDSIITGTCTDPGDLDSIIIGEGSGLQQLAQRSPRSTGRTSEASRSRGGGGILPHDLCKYSLTISGVTVAILEANPAYTHPTTETPREKRPPQQYSSMNSAGLDPVVYLSEVARILRGGVNRKEIQKQQEHLAQTLPLDHLLVWFSTVKTGVSLQGANTDLQLTIASCELWEFLYSNTANLPHITTPVSAALLIELLEDLSLSQPCIRLRMSTFPDHGPRKRHSTKQSSQGQVVSVDVSLTSPHMNLDPTLIERLQPLVHSLSSSGHNGGTSRGGGGGGVTGRTGSQAQIKHSLYMTTSNFQAVSQQRQAVFNQAVSSDRSNSPEQRIHFKISTSSLSLSLRFPVPELSEAQRRLPWYHPSLRQEVLHVILSHPTLTSTLHPHLPHNPSTYDAYFTQAKVFLSCDGSVEGRTLFLTVSSTPESSNNTNRAIVQLVVQPVNGNALEQFNKVTSPSAHQSSYPPHILDDLGLGLEGEWNRDEPPEPSPFSTKKNMYSGNSGTQAGEGEGAGGEHIEQLVTPGTRSEMEEFERYSSSLSQYHLSLHLPRVCVHLPSKPFFDTLYSRFAVDLSLWKPASPEQVERANAAKSLFFSSVDIQPAATAEEKVQSVLKDYSEDEEEDDDFVDHDIFRSPTSDPSYQSPGLSLLSLSLSVETASVSMLLPIIHSDKVNSNHKGSPSNQDDSSHSPGDSLYASALSDPPLLPDLCSEEMEEKRERTGGAGHSRGDTESEEEDCGLAIFEISFLHIYLVSGYLGDANHDYVCIHVDQLSLCHTGSLQSSGLTAQYSPLLDPLPQSLNTSLHHIILRLPERLQLKPTPRGSDPSPMILVAMDIRFEPERNSKTNKCAISLQGTLLNHYVTPSHLNCFTQLGEFLSLKDEPIEGYESPSLITEMHLHLQDLCLEYCPLHLPVKALLGLGSVQLSTSLVAGSPLLVVRLLVDHTHLALSDSTHHSLSVRDDYVCVLDLDWFELTLRLCNTAQFDEESKKLFSQQPEVSLECSSNILQIHTCVDSCMALRDLLVYLASDGDLRPAPDKQTKINSTASPDSVDSTTRNSSSLPPPSSTSEDMDDLLSDAMEDSPLTKTSPPTVPTLTSSVTDRPLPSTSVTSSTNKNKKMHVVEHGERSLDIDFGDSDEEEEGSVQVVEEQGERERCTSSGGVSGGIIADLIDAMEEEEEEEEEEDASLRKMKRRGKEMKKTRVTNDLDDDDGFCLLNAPTSTYVAPGAKPVIKCLLSEDETWKIVDNHFAIPEQHVDQLKRPKHFPEPVIQYTLKELTIVWHLYGGHDFALLSSSSSPSSSPHTLTTSSSGTTSRQNSTISSTEQPPNSATYSSSRSGHIAAQPSLTRGSSSQGYNSRSSSGSVHAGRKGTGKGGRSQSGWSFRGGTGRDHTVHMEVEVDKMRLQYEVFPQDTTEASRFAFLVRDLEIRDRLTQSNINKFLYQYTTETMPRQSNANMVSLKVLSCRPELEANPKEEEVSVRLSILPIRLNIDQDSFYFMFEFFSRISDSSSFYYPPSSSPPISTATTATPTQQPSSSSTHREQVFIHSFVFQPALPIKIDYTTKWRFPTDTMGTLPGILISLYHLDNSELTLKSLNCKTGFLGWDSLLECVAREWTNDIMSRQLPLILKGVGPTHYITQFVHGVVDLVRLPYHQYQEDGRIVWGLQRGASSFSTSTGLAVVELTSRTLETLQSMAQMVYDLVSPVPVEGGHANQFPSLRRAPHQPQDFREGVSNAYDVVASGLTGTAVDLYTMASQEHEERGVTGAVGGILRQIPGTVVKPVILLSEATRHVLGGVKNQFVPDARREAKEKWKTADTMTDH